MDGNCVPDILFGLDFVAAIRAVTSTPLDVHLMTRTTAGLDRADGGGWRGVGWRFTPISVKT